MKSKPSPKLIPIFLVGLFLLSLGSCNSSDSNIKLEPIFQSALSGAALGWIIGHQSNEDCPGIYLGASILGVAALLSEIDRVAEVERTTTVWVPNPDGSYSPVILRKKKDYYVGPQGEYYKKIPTPEQLQTRYGLKKDKK